MDYEEIKHLLLSIVVLSVAFSVANLVRTGRFSPYFFAVVLAGVGTGFMFHELAHKFTAQSLGCSAKYRAWPQGLAMSVLFSALGFVFASPGAVYIHGRYINRRDEGLISVAGPLTNVVIAVLALTLAFYGVFQAELLWIMGINAFLAIFNLLPVFPLDGAKVFVWGPKYWVASVSLALFVGLLLPTMFGLPGLF